MGFVDKVFGWIGKIFKLADLARQWLDEVETQYPGLVTIIMAIYNSLQDKFKAAKDVYDSTGDEAAFDATKTELRETAVELAKEATTASPRFVPEPIIRATIEMIVLQKGDYSYYDLPKVREHATYILSKRG